MTERQSVADSLRKLSAYVNVAGVSSVLQRAAELVEDTSDEIAGDPPAPPTAKLRTILPLACGDCGFLWIAPTKGACPKCHTENVQVRGEQRVCDAPRV
jgi:predicted Zn-ribbon and HTH transcriptional regulator